MYILCIKSACPPKTNTTVGVWTVSPVKLVGKEILYPTNPFFENESKIKIFPDEQENKKNPLIADYITGNAKEVLQAEKMAPAVNNPGKEINSSQNGK